MLPFDGTQATHSEVRVGLEAEVVTGIGLGAQLKVRLLLIEADETRVRPFEEGFGELQLLGLLSAWSLGDAQAAAGESGPLTREAAGALLLKYYGDRGGNVRASSDRVLVLDEHFGDAPKIPIEDLASLAAEQLRPQLRAAVKDLKPFSLGSVLNAFNGVLQQAEVGQHFFLIDVDSDRHVVVAARNDAFARAAHGSVLRLVT